MRIYLIGFMGSGKTHWGRIWANLSGWSFLDLDQKIEEEEKLTVEEIFDKKGEVYFRKRETAALRDTQHLSQTLIACGGGTPCHDDNMQWMNEQGFTVYLKDTPVRLMENILSDSESRPLLRQVNKGEMLFFIEQKLKEREMHYLSARMICPLNEVSEQSIRQILDAAETHRV